MANEFINIPGNIKQLYAPFVLDPGNALFTTPIKVATDDGKEQPNVSASGKTQYFSFRPQAFEGKDGCNTQSAGFIRIAPASFYNENNLESPEVSFIRPKNDLSYKLLYNRESGDKTGILGENLLNFMPYVSIREYMHDSKLDQVFNLFNSFKQGFDAGSQAAQSENSGMKQFAEKVWNFTKKLVSQIGTTLKDAGKAQESEIKSVYYSGTDDYDWYVLKIPYLLYYKLIGTTSTNIYEIPYNGKVLYSSDGASGWNTKNGLAGIDGSGGPGGNPIINALRDYVGKNIKINTTPTWSTNESEQPTKITVEFKLYNDSLDAAMKNFIFVNSIIPGNKWIQYHIYQHSPSLYDIKIAGIDRLFMCAGTFSCEQLGILRVPSEKFIKILESSHLNPNAKLSGKTDYKFNDLIRIPDVYSIKLDFTSLLPTNFNNYLYSYYMNDKISTIEGNDLHNKSILDPFTQAVTEKIVELWNSTGPGDK